jgi:hypothetical protein
MMYPQIETWLGACWTITFLNTTHEKPTPTVWVCTNQAAYYASLSHLRLLKHIEIVQGGPSHVQDGGFGPRHDADLSV